MKANAISMLKGISNLNKTIQTVCSPRGIAVPINNPAETPLASNHGGFEDLTIGSTRAVLIFFVNPVRIIMISVMYRIVGLIQAH